MWPSWRSPGALDHCRQPHAARWPRGCCGDPRCLGNSHRLAGLRLLFRVVQCSGTALCSLSSTDFVWLGSVRSCISPNHRLRCLDEKWHRLICCLPSLMFASLWCNGRSSRHQIGENVNEMPSSFVQNMFCVLRSAQRAPCVLFSRTRRVGDPIRQRPMRTAAAWVAARPPSSRSAKQDTGRKDVCSRFGSNSPKLTYLAFSSVCSQALCGSLRSLYASLSLLCVRRRRSRHGVETVIRQRDAVLFRSEHVLCAPFCSACTVCSVQQNEKSR